MIKSRRVRHFKRNTRKASRHYNQAKRNTRKVNHHYNQAKRNINAFKSKLDDLNTDLILIGQGAAGAVYLDPDQPNVVFKVGSKSNTCRIWGKEQKIYKQLKKHNIDTDLVLLLQMNQFNTYSDTCIIELSRVVNPINTSANYTVQVQFGTNSIDRISPGRGRFLGLSQLKDLDIISEDMIPEYAKQLGTVIGRLHFIAKNDGYDLEVFAGTKNEKIILYIGDFDLSEMITEYGDEQIKRMAWTLEAVPYFPTLDQADLYELFKTAYLEVADSVGQRKVGEAVLKIYTDI